MNDTAQLEPAEGSHWHFGLAILRRTVKTWDRRIRFRRDFEKRSKASPHLIADIGLTKRQAETEIAKPFWQV